MPGLGRSNLCDMLSSREEVLISAATTSLTLQLPTEIRERLAELARATDQPEVGLAAEAIRSYVELQEWQIGEIEQGLREAKAGEFASDDEVAAVFAKWTHGRPPEQL